MLVKVLFPFRATYIRPRGRSAIASDFLSEETVEIADIATDDADIAYRLVPGRHFKMLDGAVFRRPPPRALMEWQGRLYWPMMDQAGFRPIDARRWGLELGKLAGRHTDRSHRKPGYIPDVLGLTGMINGRQWPGWRMEAVAMRTVVESGRENAAARLRREAARLVMIGDKLYREGPEPVWLVRANIHHFDVISQALQLDAVDHTTPGLFDGPLPDDPLVPFLHYELFRADMEQDAEALIKQRLAANVGNRDYHAAPARWRVEKSAALPDHDVLTPMLHGLHDSVAKMITWAIAAVRREVRSLTEMPDQEVATAHGPDYLRRLADVSTLPPDASARQMTGWISEVLQRLDGVDTTVDAFGHVETIVRGLRRAAERADRDLANGLVPLTEADREDQGPLDLLACA